MLSLSMLLGMKLSDIAKMHPWYLKTNPSSSWSSPKTTLLHRLHLLCDQIWDSMFFCAPLLPWLWSKFLLKNHVSLKTGINSNSFGPFLEIFFKNHQKNWRKLKIHQKMAKYERNF